ncbi:hypothetical protein DPMN_003917 [Dreissena polymorpha]|uniref:Uncharacterized protein n=1 Tax=Dreissena polymorpha TaxID=45954 RepID=A0A9D4RV61_DREPO|nr:hypothetical protein DPMN_003917 [Dreissena polymorpha]
MEPTSMHLALASVRTHVTQVCPATAFALGEESVITMVAASATSLTLGRVTNARRRAVQAGPTTA